MKKMMKRCPDKLGHAYDWYVALCPVPAELATWLVSKSKRLIEHCRSVIFAMASIIYMILAIPLMMVSQSLEHSSRLCWRMIGRPMPKALETGYDMGKLPLLQSGTYTQAAQAGGLSLERPPVPPAILCPECDTVTVHACCVHCGWDREDVVEFWRQYMAMRRAQDRARNPEQYN